MEQKFEFSKFINKNDRLLFKKKRNSTREINKCFDIYPITKLDKGQFEFFEYVQKNDNKIIIIQSGPGTGKTHTLLTLINNISHKKFIVTIFKHDLLFRFKEFVACFTTTSLFMQLFDIPKYFQYNNLVKYFNSHLEPFELTSVIVFFLKRLNLSLIKDSTLILDEYTTVPKIFLLILLIAAKFHNLDIIFCGDKNQLQNIIETKYITLSSHAIVSYFAHKQFEFKINHRTVDSYHNDFIDCLSNLCTSKRLDDFAYSFLAIIFPEKLIKTPEQEELYATHLSSTYKENHSALHALICKYQICCDYYYIIPNKKSNEKICGQLLENGLYLPQYVSNFIAGNGIIDTYLPYLPLIRGAIYCCEIYSELSEGILYDIKFNDTFVNGKLISTPIEVIIRFEHEQMENGEIIKKINFRTYVKEANNDVLFENHKNALLGNGGGIIFHFPIYPKETLMSIHMSQGNTIQRQRKVVMYFSPKTTYRGLYVLMSRPNSPDQIMRIVIPNQMLYLFSAIVNFPELCNVDVKLSIDKVYSKLVTDFKLYRIDDEHKISIAVLCVNFINSTKTEERQMYRENLIKLTNASYKLKKHEKTLKKVCNTHILLKYDEILFKLSKLYETDSRIWLQVFSQFDSEIKLLTEFDETVGSESNLLRVYCNLSSLKAIKTSLNGYILNSDELCEHINAQKLNEKDIFSINVNNRENHQRRVSSLQYEIFTELKNKSLSPESLLQLLDKSCEIVEILEPAKKKRKQI